MAGVGLHNARDKFNRITSGMKWEADPPPQSAISEAAAPTPAAPPAPSYKPNVVAPQNPTAMGPPQPTVADPAPAAGSSPSAQAPAYSHPSGRSGAGSLYKGIGAHGEKVFSYAPGDELPANDRLTVVPAYQPSGRTAAAPQARFPAVGRTDPRVADMHKEMSALSSMITSGIGPNGRPLTADGMRALVMRANGLTRGITDLYGDDTGLGNTAIATQGRLDQQGLANAGQLDVANARGAMSIAEMIASGLPQWNAARSAAVRDELTRQSIPPSIVEAYDASLDGTAGEIAYNNRVIGQAWGNRFLVEAGGLDEGIAAATAALAEAGVDPYKMDEATALRVQNDPSLHNTIMGLRDLQDRKARSMVMSREQQGVQSYAEGGLVGAMPTPELGSPQSMNMTAIQNYQRYVATAREMGLEPMSMDEFAKFATAPMMGGPNMPEMQPTAQSAGVVGMADGGEVPGIMDLMGGGQQVDGKVVVDPDPNAPTDSIPALIDGQQPAALDSGEFVIPEDVVRFYGTDKLSKMIEKARGGGQPAPQGASDV